MSEKPVLLKHMLSSLVNFKYYPVVLTLLICAIFLPIFLNSGPLLEVDQPVWTSIAYLLKTEIVPEQKWFWGIHVSQENAGLTLGENYSFSLIILWVLSILFEVILAVKIATLFSALILALSFYYLAINFSRPVFAAIAAFIFVSGTYGYITDGMWYHSIAIAFSLLFFNFIVKYLKDQKIVSWLLSLAFLLLSFYTHPIGALGSVFVWFVLFIYILFSRDIILRKETILSFLLLLISSILLAAPQWLALLQPGRTLYSFGELPLDFKDFRSFVGLLLNLNLLDTRFQILIILTSISSFFFLKLKKKTWIFPLFGIYIMGIFIVLRLPKFLPIDISFLNELLFFSKRFQFLSQVVYLILSIIFFDGIFRLYMNHRTSKEAHMFTYGLLILTFCISILFIAHSTFKMAFSPRLQTLGSFEKQNEVMALWKWLDENVEYQKARVFIEDSMGTYKTQHTKIVSLQASTHILALTSVYSRIMQFGGWCKYFTRVSKLYKGNDGGYIFNERARSSLSGDKLNKLMRLLNCTYLVVHSPESKSYLDSVHFLEMIQSIGNFQIYKHKSMIPAWAYVQNPFLPANVKRISSIEYRIEVKSELYDPLSISIAYDPRWKAYYNNYEIPLYDKDGLIQLILPMQGVQEINLKYEIEKKKAFIFFAIGLFFIITYFIFVKANAIIGLIE